MKIKVVVATAVLLLLLVVPIVVAQTQPTEERHLHGVSLQETDVTEVTFYNAKQEIQLGGLLFAPEGEGPFPGVVIIHGSGSSRRDNPWYLSLVDELQQNGIVVLLPDKRGSVMSGGDWHTASFEDLATDTAAAVGYLREQDTVAVSHVGIVGMSQGGHFAPMVANQNETVSLIVNVVGAAVPIHQQLRYEENHNLRQMGVLPGISNLIAYPAAWSIRELRQKEFWDAVGNYDPLPDWQALEVPALVLYGADDTNTPTAASAARLRSLNKANIDVLIFAGSGHALEDPPGTGNRIFRADALQEIRAFIKENA